MNSFSYPDIAVIIPCYRVTDKITAVIQGIPPFVKHIICIDDSCPDQSGKFIAETIKDHRLKILFHQENCGVGGAVITGYKAGLDMGAQIFVKIDGDGQMDPAIMPLFIDPIIEKTADYTKGNRFFLPEYIQNMPRARIFGNAVLSFLTKFSSGYWHIFDPTNGYTAIHASALKNIPLDKISQNYFFETDMLFRLNIIGAVAQDVPMKSIYGDEKSNLKILKIIPYFLSSHIRNFYKRIIYTYFIRDFSIASVELICGLFLFSFGLFYGLTQWGHSINTGETASAGTVMLCALPLLLGFQLLLSFLHYDIQSTPRNPLQKKLQQ